MPVRAVSLFLVLSSMACRTSTPTDPSTIGSSEDEAGEPPLDPSEPIIATQVEEEDEPIDPALRRDLPLTMPSLAGYALEPVYVDLVTMPMAIVYPASGGPFVLERWGRIVRIEGTTAREVLDFQDATTLRSEAGALGMALHPRFPEQPYVYVWYNAEGRLQRLSRFTWSNDVFGNELVMIELSEGAYEHNAGHMQFGSDGFLYFGNGDDLNVANHQTISRSIFAGIFRIDVDRRADVSHPPPRQPEGGVTQGYFIPNDNPFVGVPHAIEEFYALGLRNPFGWAFDRGTGELWLADVGEVWREEVNRVVSGGNYQWPQREGELERIMTPMTIGTDQPPVSYYTHAELGDLTSILGGSIYRGAALPELVGKYVHSDWPSARLWSVDPSTAARTTLLEHNAWSAIMALGEDQAGEILVFGMNGISRLVRDTSGITVPTTLSHTTLFDDVRALVPAAGFTPYVLASPLWSDGAAKTRWIRVPGALTVGEDGAYVFPVGTILMKHFELPAEVVPENRSHRLETRVLVVGNDGVYGLTYAWNTRGTDATLVREPTDETIVDTATSETRTWHYPSSGQCWSCHRADNRVLGVRPTALVSLSDPSASLEARATSYLAANCSSCHRAGNSFIGGEETWNASPGVALADRRLVNARHHNSAMARGVGLANAPLIEPGHPERSILLARIRSTDPDLMMPPLGRTHVDEAGAALIEEWIRSLPQD